MMDSLTPYVAEKSANDNNYTDFFKITKEIESSNATEEEKAKFYQAFDDYNWSRQRTSKERAWKVLVLSGNILMTRCVQLVHFLSNLLKPFLGMELVHADIA